MFLKNISLRNFKCHENLYLDFSAQGSVKSPVRKTTFLVGENGTGKSALLQAVAMVTGGSEALRAMPGFPDAYIRHGQVACDITATIATAQGEERLLHLHLQRAESVANAVQRARNTLAPMDAALRHTHRSYFTSGFGSGRRIDTAARSAGYYYPASGARYAAVHSLFREDALLHPLFEWASQLLQRSGGDGVAVLQDSLNTFLPPEVRFHSLSPEGQLLFRTADGILPLHLLSNGYQQTMAWVGDLLYHVTRTFGDYKNPLSARGLLLIDEIDLHLHPCWQRKIYAFLKKGLPNFQVIATAYSPLTVQQAGQDELFAMYRSGEGKAAIAPLAVAPPEAPWQQYVPALPPVADEASHPDIGGSAAGVRAAT